MNGAGEMYTRIADFDIIGCDPMFFKYAYIPYTSKLPGTNYFSNLTEWGLPPEDWRPQESIPLEGNAAVSRFIRREAEYPRTRSPVRGGALGRGGSLPGIRYIALASARFSLVSQIGLSGCL
jgi:hypothetical protein